MGCLGDREKGPPDQTAKWSYLTLDDFKCTSTWSPLAYGWLWFMAIVAVAVFCVDTFTAINLLFYNKWNSQVQPALPFKYSRWIFAGCIMLSWVLYIYEWQRALRVIKRDGVAESYMDPLAVSLQSMRGKGWRRFLVFTELTKSKKGADYAALFAYFSFQGAVRVILAEGPRQGINGMTLYAVLQADILKTGDHVAIVQFFLNIQALAEQNSEQAAIYFSMLFTLIIWVFSALSLITAALLYIIFLWHYIPSSDGRLSKYCRRKIDKRLGRIVEHKVKAALEEEERVKRKAERKELKRQKTDLGSQAPSKPQIARQPTLPSLLASPETKQDDKLPEFSLARQDTNATVATLPLYESRPSTAQGSRAIEKQPSLPDLAITNRTPMPPSRTGTPVADWSRPGMGPRAETQASGWSNAAYADEAPLLANAGYAGGSGAVPTVPPPAFYRQDSSASYSQPREGYRPRGPNVQGPGKPFPPSMSRSDTMNSSRPFTPMSASGIEARRPFSPMSANGPTGSRPFSPMSARSMPPDRALSPMSRAGNVNPGQSFMPRSEQVASPIGQPRAPETPASARNETGFSFNFEPQSAINASSPATSYRPMPPQQSSNAPFFNSDAPPLRQLNNSKINSQQSFGQPPARQMSVTSFSRPTPPALDDRASQNSYEMTAQPLHSQPAPSRSGGYLAFNPGMRNTGNAPMPTPISTGKNAPAAMSPAFLPPHEAPRRGVTVAGGPGTEESYFGHVREISMLPASNAASEPRHSVAPYDDILDDYGSATQGETAARLSPSPSPQTGPMRSMTPARPQGR